MLSTTLGGGHNNFLISYFLPTTQDPQEQSQVSMYRPPWSAWEEMEELGVFGRRWEYRGEGNANIVIALLDESRVLRLPKVEVGKKAQGDWGRERRRVEREVAFAYQVFIPLLGLDCVGHSKAVFIAPHHIQLLNQCLISQRPDYRLHKELQIPFATSHRDFARIHSPRSRRRDYCIEIKPKQGWWPKHLRNDHTHPKLCTFCLNQFLKLELSKIKKRSDYCPLDLFSGCPERMVTAILSLVANPQNNFRIFRDGQLMYGDTECDSLPEIFQEWFQPLLPPATTTPTAPQPPQKSLHNFAFLLCTALLKPQSKRHEEYDKFCLQVEDVLLNCCPSTPPPHPSRAPRACTDSKKVLPIGCVLKKILDIQQMADIPGGVDHIYSLFRRICPIHCKSRGTPRGVEEVYDIDVDEEVTNFFKGKRKHDLPEMRMCSEEEEDGGSSSSGASETSSLSLDEDEDEETLREDLQQCPGAQCSTVETWMEEVPGDLTPKEVAQLESYLISAIAKDCSIMMTFSPLHGDSAPKEEEDSVPGRGDFLLQDLQRNLHRVRIGVADLAPKPVTCIAKHFLRDRDMLKDYHNHTNNPPRISKL